MEWKKVVIDWSALARIVYEKTGKMYKTNYLMSVKGGHAANKKLEDLFIEMGVIEQKKGGEK